MKHLLTLILMVWLPAQALELSLPLQRLIEQPTVAQLMDQTIGNVAVVRQQGIVNEAQLIQGGGQANLVVLTQQGWMQKATVSQKGSSNIALMAQEGSHNQASIAQEGQGNLAITHQATDNSAIAIHQVGRYNRAVVNDYSRGGDPLSRQVNQTGSFRTVTINHY